MRRNGLVPVFSVGLALASMAVLGTMPAAIGQPVTAATAVVTPTARVAAPSAPKPPDGPWGPSRLIDPAAGWLDQVSCASDGYCAAIDSYGSVITNARGGWSSPRRVVPPGHTSLSCTSREFCLAVGGKAHASIFDGSGWRHIVEPADRQLRYVSCSSPTFCVGLDAHRAWTYDGTTWSHKKTIDPYATLTAISCSADRQCIAGDDGGTLYQLLDGTIWEPGLGLGQNAIRSISCSAQTYCLAMDNDGKTALYSPATYFKLVATPPGVRDTLACGAPKACVMVGGTDATFFDGKHWTAPEQVVTGESVHDVSCSAPTACVALSDFDAATYDGTSWDVRRADQGAGGWMAVSCPISSFCAATDYYGNALTYRDGSWSPDAVIDRDGYGLYALQCTSATFCATGDVIGNVLTFDGTGWTDPENVGIDFVNGISCTSSTFCVAAGYGAVSMYDGTSWSPAESLDPGYFFTSVSCASSTFCLAIDEGKNVTRALVWDGHDWSAPVQIASDQIEAFSLQCLSRSFCMAVTERDAFATYDEGTWSDWGTIPGYLGPTSVSCTTPTFCVAVGEQSRSLWDGIAWSQPTRIDPSTPPHGGSFQDVGLTGVSCSSPKFCAAVNARGRALMTDRP